MIKLIKSSAFVAMATVTLTGCNNDELKQQLITESLNNMVYIEGGSFLMGDFGPQYGEEKLPFSWQKDDKYLHKVILDSFSMGKYKVTYREYDIYTSINNKKKLLGPKILIRHYPNLRDPNVPAATSWQEAKDYCQWLGKESGKNIDLPTEAQWEYAARSRGEFMPFATDNGLYTEGINTPSTDQIDAMSGISYATYLVGQFPPNPIGLYDMGFNGRDWINDWYAADYYHQSPERNPTGPESGTLKVTRGYGGGGGGGEYRQGLTMFRNSAVLDPLYDGSSYEKSGRPSYYVFRCVINNADKPATLDSSAKKQDQSRVLGG